ncbi:50S ribosomal protein L31 [Candidatus Vidania fulgoroideae]|uniref:50S ribosomal protein L31 n=1 Tax=Candidatus Vidania fulgoroideorum TaxID=881286 RepID=A0A974X7J0_9PROT|nr:50S ribosomal protein L31 [Candidatus Vidania fulgoroideae]
MTTTPYIKTYTTVFIDKITQKKFTLTTCIKTPLIKLDITSDSHPAFTHKNKTSNPKSQTSKLIKKINI